MTKRRSNLGFWLAFGFILWAAMLPAPAPAEEAPSQQGNECRVNTQYEPNTYFYIPCNQAGPTRDPYLWLSEGQEV
jgi:hypothetical protein